MQRKPDEPGSEYREPETQQDLHRPQGMPHPRESKSQHAQLSSEHRHGTNKAIKLGMAKKTGTRKGSHFTRANNKDS